MKKIVNVLTMIETILICIAAITVVSAATVSGLIVFGAMDGSLNFISSILLIICAVAFVLFVILDIICTNKSGGGGNKYA